MTELEAAQRDFMNGDATGLQALYSHRVDVTVMDASAASSIAGPKLALALPGRPHNFAAASTIRVISACLWAGMSPV